MHMHIVRSNDIQHTFAHTGKFVLEIRPVRRLRFFWFVGRDYERVFCGLLWCNSQILDANFYVCGATK